ncbi:Bifunctional protein GlmU [Thermoplasmatales archaeon]|nr:Bifunctional protein GlmU [Thermoplasmatales archaeon]
MRPLSYIIPKVLLPVRGKPVLDYLLTNLVNLPVEHHYLVVSEHYDTIQNYLEKTNMHNVSVVKGLGWETGGDLSIALQEIGMDDDLVVMNGDIITDVNLEELFDYHLKVEAPVSMALFELNDEDEAKRFGQISLEKDGSISEFLEKNEKIKRKSNLVNVGFYVFGKKFLQESADYLIPRKFKLETELFPDLAKRHMLFGMPMKINYWWDVGTMSSYLRAEHYFINGQGIIPP